MKRRAFLISAAAGMAGSALGQRQILPAADNLPESIRKLRPMTDGGPIKDGDHRVQPGPQVGKRARRLLAGQLRHLRYKAV